MYVIIGGFRAVALTDTVQGIIMLVGTVHFVNWYDCCRRRDGKYYVQSCSRKSKFISPFGSERELTPLYVSSFWVLVGVGVIGLPQIAVRAISYKNSKSMHMAIIIGTLVIGTIMFGMHLIGVLARAVIIPGIEIGDKVMPTLDTGNFAAHY